jgi:hypothetical protein
MKFLYAYQFAAEGYAIRRKGWSGYLHATGDESAGIYLLWDETNEPVTFGNESNQLSYDDLNSDDWEFIPSK